jgi:hydroxymethylglutaryl-CoA lyase
MEAEILSVDSKFKLFERLIACPYQRLEITSFVHPKWIPQLAYGELLCEKIFSAPSGSIPMECMAFVPNLKGLDRLLRFPIEWVSCFVAVSETFNKKNVNCGIDEIFLELRQVVQRAHANGKKARLYVSTVFGCPYEGKIPYQKLKSTLQKASELGADEIALSDTMGVAVPREVKETLELFSHFYPSNQMALHLHDTYGLAIASAIAGYEAGIRKFDGSTGGIGGCPYAKGATGNVASEDLWYALKRTERVASVHLDSILAVSEFLAFDLKLPVRSHLFEIHHKGGTLHGTG